jgi:hypothetical protein
MRSAALALLGSLLAALVAASAAPAAVEGGTIWVNRGSAGITLTMKRATVLNRLGQPLYENQNGYMQYAEEPDLFDVYLNSRNRVRLLGISGEGFCVNDGPCMWDRNGVRKLRAKFGDRLKELEDETGQTILVVRGRFEGHRVFTAFTPTTLRGRGKINMVFIGRCPPKRLTCGV